MLWMQIPLSQHVLDMLDIIEPTETQHIETRQSRARNELTIAETRKETQGVA